MPPRNKPQPQGRNAGQPEVQRPVIPDPPPCTAPSPNLTTFYHLLFTQTPRVASTYDVSALKGTGTPAGYDINEVKKNLDKASPTPLYRCRGLGLIFAPDLLADLIETAEEHLRGIPVEWDNPAHRSLIAHIHPYITTAKLPPTIYSEKDSERWVMDGLLQPALLVLRHEQGQQLCPPSTLPAETQRPHLSSAPNRGAFPIPDALLVKRGCKPAEEGFSMPLTVEVKVHTVCAYGEDDIFSSLQKEHSTYRPGALMWFNWPRTADHVTKVTDRIIVQVISQMHAYKNNMCILSWYKGTIFFLRRGTRYYLSPTYNNETAVLIAIYAWFAKALELEWIKDVNFNHPLEEHMDHWDKKRMQNVEEAGLCIPTLFGDPAIR